MPHYFAVCRTVRMMPHYFAVCRTVRMIPHWLWGWCHITVCRTVRTMPHWLWDDATLLCCLQDCSWLLGPCHIDCEDDATLLCCLQDCEDHATLLCSLLLGFGLDAYVCFGTKVKGAVHAWVMTISTDGLVTFWESLSGHRSVGCGLCFCWWGWGTLLFSCLKMNITYHEKKGLPNISGLVKRVKLLSVSNASSHSNPKNLQTGCICVLL